MTDNYEKISDDEVNALKSKEKLRDVKRVIKSKNLDFDKTHKEIGLLVTKKLSQEHVAIWEETNHDLALFVTGFQNFLEYKIFADKDDEISKILDQWIEKNKP